MHAQSRSAGCASGSGRAGLAIGQLTGEHRRFMARPRLTHRLELRFYRLVERAVGWLSMDTCAAVGRALGRLFHLLSPRYRRLVRRNLRIATATGPLLNPLFPALRPSPTAVSGASPESKILAAIPSHPPEQGELRPKRRP